MIEPIEGPEGPQKNEPTPPPGVEPMGQLQSPSIQDIPKQEQPIKPIELSSYNPQQIADQIKVVEQSSLKIDQNIQAVELVDFLRETSFENFLEFVHANTLADAHAIEEGGKIIAGAKTLGDFSSNVLEIFEEIGVGTAEDIVGPLLNKEELLDSIASKIYLADLAIKGPIAFGKAGQLIYKRILLNRMYGVKQELVDALEKKSTPKLEAQLKKINVYIETNEKELHKDSLVFGLETIAMLPGAARAGLRATGHLTTPLAFTTSTAAILLSTATKGVELYEARAKALEQREWIEHIKDKPITKEEFEKLLETRKEAFTSQEKEEINVQTRSAIKTLSLTKQKAEQKFFTYKLAAAAIGFTATAAIGITTIILLGLVLGGVIASPTIPLIILAGVSTALGLTLMFAGLAFLIYTRPNLMRTYFQGVQANILLKSIPATLQSWELERKKTEQFRLLFAEEALRANFEELKALKEMKDIKAIELPKHLQPLAESLQIKAYQTLQELDIEQMEQKHQILVDNLKKKQLQLDEKIKELDTKVKARMDKIAKLKEEIAIASFEDFARAIKSPLSFVEVKDALIVKLIEKPDLLEDETKKLMQLHMGVDLSGLDKKEIQAGLGTFFSLRDDALIKFIQKQTREHAI